MARNHQQHVGEYIKSEVEVVRTRITLECTECKNRNYNMTKDKKTHPERMETKKYCRFCKSHTLHKRQIIVVERKWIMGEIQKLRRRAGSKDLRQSSGRSFGQTRIHLLNRPRQLLLSP